MWALHLQSALSALQPGHATLLSDAWPRVTLQYYVLCRLALGTSKWRHCDVANLADIKATPPSQWPKYAKPAVYAWLIGHYYYRAILTTLAVTNVAFSPTPSCISKSSNARFLSTLTAVNRL